MLRRIFWIVITVLWIGFIFFNSTRTSTESSEASNTLLNIANNILRIFNITIDSDTLSVIIRKGAHLFEYFMLGIFFNNSIINPLIKNKNQTNEMTYIYSYKLSLISYYLSTLSFCLLIAVVDEHIQGLTDGRAKSIGDVLIDFGGCLVAVIIIMFIKSKKIKSTLNIK